MDSYSTAIVHQYRAKDIFQWFRLLGLREIIVMNSRAGWVSIVAEKGSSNERATRISDQKQIKGPTIGGMNGAGEATESALSDLSA
ncbi:MAG: hypothetical protein FJW29_11885 [Acidobacteria bacterium]|nr:hypothetical protein [Acidobacteriota bacterium]